MSYRIQSGETVDDALRRVAREQIDKAITEIKSESLDVHKKVHQVRKRCKKLRGLIRLTRPAFEDTYQAENRCFRDAARELSDFRDAKSIISTYDDVLDRFDDQVDRTAFASIRSQLTRQLHAIDPGSIKTALVSVGNQLENAAGRIGQWTLAEDGFDAVAGGLAKTHGRAVQRLKDLHKAIDTEGLHQWRKRVKYHWYHLRLLRPLWSTVMKSFAKQADKLGDLLGDDHDLAVFSQSISSDKTEYGNESDILVLQGLISMRRGELQQRALRIGRCLFAEPTSSFCDRIHEYWRVR